MDKILVQAIVLVFQGFFFLCGVIFTQCPFRTFKKVTPKKKISNLVKCPFLLSNK